MESKLTISEYTLEEKNKDIIGGVFLRSSEGVIVCDNSLDSRVRLLFEQLLPNIRQLLFPKVAQEHSLIWLRLSYQSLSAFYWTLNMSYRWSFGLRIQKKALFWCSKSKFWAFITSIDRIASTTKIANYCGSFIITPFSVINLDFVDTTCSCNNRVWIEITVLLNDYSKVAV